MNNITLIGRITKEIEKKESNGKVYARFTLAVPRPYKKDETDFINCVVFGNTAEVLAKYTTKGSRLAVNGILQSNTYEKDGEKRTVYEILVGTVEFLENKKTGNEVETEDEFPF